MGGIKSLEPFLQPLFGFVVTPVGVAYTLIGFAVRAQLPKVAIDPLPLEFRQAVGVIKQALGVEQEMDLKS
jgi:hypothetical protein